MAEPSMADFVPPVLDTHEAEFWRGFEAGTNWVGLATLPFSQAWREYVAIVQESNVENICRMLEKLRLEGEWFSAAEPGFMHLRAYVRLGERSCGS